MRSFLQHVIDLDGREWALHMAPWHANAGALVAADTPPGFPLFANRAVRLGFDHYPIPEPERLELCLHYLDAGVRIPGTPYKIRALATNRIEFVESDGSEPELPLDWLQYVRIEDVFIGKRVAADWDLTGYSETPDGWVREVIAAAAR